MGEEERGRVGIFCKGFCIEECSYKKKSKRKRMTEGPKT